MIPATAPPETMSVIPEPDLATSPPLCDPTFKISAAARPSGYGRSLFTTMARRNGMVNNTPREPPHAQIKNVCQNGNPCQ